MGVSELSIGRTISFFISLLLTLSLPAQAMSAGLMVLYPEVREPYSKVYQDIIDGVKTTYNGSVMATPLKDRQSEDAYRAAVNSSKPDMIIALGQNALNLASRIAPGVPTVMGATSATNLKVAGVSMIPDPAVVITKLHQLDSELSTIHVVTNPADKQKLLQAALKHANSLNIKFIVHEVTSIKDAASVYRDLLLRLGRHDSIWLMQDQALNDISLLSLILERAWERKIIVFSSNPADVKRGALFSVYPNNVALGARLAEITTTYDFSKESSHDIEFLREILIAGNERTLRHLGLTTANEAHRVFDKKL